MKAGIRMLTSAALTAAAALAGGTGFAQQVTGVPGSPSATTTIAASSCRRPTRSSAA